jgi:heme-degrading monooxygenase HmoA
MLVVIFEAEPTNEGHTEYLQRAEQLRPLLDGIDGFMSIERFESLSSPGRILSLSAWENEEAVSQWRATEAHLSAQQAGRDHIFDRYRIRVADILRDRRFDRYQTEVGVET